MIGLWILLAFVVVGVSFVFWYSSRRKRVRAKLRSERLPSDMAAQIEEGFPLWSKVPEDLRRDTEGWMQVFLAEKNFEACGGIEMIDIKMKLAVAAPACLLLARRPEDYYERLRTILIYPDAFRVKNHLGAEQVNLGESWGTGSVVLSWQSVVQGNQDYANGLNVVLHEFAHQLDQEDGAADGVPELDSGADYGRWSQTMAKAYDSFCARVNEGRRTVLDDYGAESPAEFFAVATETFFERAEALREEEPEVYAELQKFYRMDPASW